MYMPVWDFAVVCNLRTARYLISASLTDELPILDAMPK